MFSLINEKEMLLLGKTDLLFTNIIIRHTVEAIT